MSTIDISYWQHHPDFNAIRASGVTRVIMKAAGAEIGSLYADSVYIANRATARSVGLAVGSYFFNGPVNPTAAADYYFSIIDYHPGDYVTLDCEYATNVTRWNAAQCVAFFSRLIQRGVRIVDMFIYMSSSVTRAENWTPLVNMGIKLWVASYGSNNGTMGTPPNVAYWPGWSIWQYTSAKTVPGIAGNVDTNTEIGGLASLVMTPITSSSQDEDITTFELIQSNDPKNPEFGRVYYSVNRNGRWYVDGPTALADYQAYIGGIGQKADVKAVASLSSFGPIIAAPVYVPPATPPIDTHALAAALAPVLAPLIPTATAAPVVNIDEIVSAVKAAIPTTITGSLV